MRVTALVVVVVIVVIVWLLVGGWGFLFRGSIVGICRRSWIIINGNWSTTASIGSVRSVILLSLGVLLVVVAVVVNHCYDDGFVTVFVILQQSVNDAVDLGIGIRTASLQRHRVGTVLVGPVIVSLVRAAHCRRCRRFIRPPGRVRFFRGRGHRRLVHRTVVVDVRRIICARRVFIVIVVVV